MTPADRGKESYMYLYEENGRYYVQKSKKDESEKATIPKEIFDMYRRDNWRESKHKEREKKCRDGKGIRCKDDCSKCSWREMGRPLSLEQLAVDGIEPAGSFLPEEFIIQQETYQELHIAISTLDDFDRGIIELYYFEDMAERQIGQELGVVQKTVNNHKKSSLKKLSKVLEKNQ